MNDPSSDDRRCNGMQTPQLRAHVDSSTTAQRVIIEQDHVATGPGLHCRLPVD
jgi:hypothetical protein